MRSPASRRRRRSTASPGSGSTASPEPCSARFSAARTGSVRSSRSGRHGTRRSNVLVGRPTAYASSLPMPPKLSSKRSSFLGFQPPAVGDEEVAAVADAIRSGWLTTGPRAEELERRFAEYVGATHALAVSSGTAAMHLALVAMGIGPGEEVITTPVTWPATVNVIVHAGATPVFADVDPDTLNIDPARVAELVTPRTKAIMPVHLYGQPADLDPLWALGVPVVEDAAHAAESEYRGRKIGGLSDATCFSLYATKSIAAGEGGIVTTSSDELAARVRDLTIMRRGHGSLYDIAVPGYKANLSDVLAAIALSQLDKVERHRELRIAQVELYDAAVA